MPTSSGSAARAPLHGEDAFGRRRHRVLSQRHRHRARVSGHAVDLDRVAARAVDRGDDADRQILGLEHRPLLDVELGVGEHVLLALRRLADALRVEVETAHRLAHADALAIDRLEHFLPEGPRHRAAAEQRRVEARAFLVGEADHLDREGEAPAARVERADAFDPGDHAEHAVVLAGVAHGVEMRAEHERWQARPLSLVTADAVPRGVEARVHARLAHPAEDERVRVPLLAREIDAGKAALELRELRQRLAVIPDPLRGGLDGLRHGAPPSVA